MVRRAVIREAFDRGSCKLSHEGYQGIISESRKTWVKYPDEERMLLDQILSVFFVPSLPSSYLLDLVFLLSWLFLCVWRSVTPFQTVERLCSFSVLSYYKIRVFDECIVSERQLLDLMMFFQSIKNWLLFVFRTELGISIHSPVCLIAGNVPPSMEPYNIEPYIRKPRKIVYTTLTLSSPHIPFFTNSCWFYFLSIPWVHLPPCFHYYPSNLSNYRIFRTLLWTVTQRICRKNSYSLLINMNTGCDCHPG